MLQSYCLVQVWGFIELLSGPSKGYYLVQVRLLAYFYSGFKRFLHTQLSSCLIFCAQLSGNFLEIAFFRKRVQKLGFSIFSVLSLNFVNSLFLGLLKHYKNRGLSNFLSFLLLIEKKVGKKNDNWNFWIWVFCSKKGRFVTHILFSKKEKAETTILIVFLGCALFGPSCQKKEILDTRPKKGKFGW